MLMPNSQRWNSVVLQLLTRVAPPVVAATVLLAAVPGNSPAQTGWKWKRPHADAVAAPAAPPKNGFATSITRLMDQARTAAQQGDFEAALQSAERAEKLADAAAGVLGTHADCSPEAASKLVQDLRVLQAASSATPQPPANPVMAAAPVRPATTGPAAVRPTVVRPQPVPVAAVPKPQAPGNMRYPQPPVIARQDVAASTPRAVVPAQPVVRPFVPTPLTPPPVAAVASRPVVAAGADPKTSAPVAVRRRYDTVVTADLTVASASVSAPAPVVDYLALGGIAIIDGGEAETMAAQEAVSAAPALPDDAAAAALIATAPRFPEEPQVEAIADTPYVNTFQTESLTLVDEPAKPAMAPSSVVQSLDEVQLVADEPVGLTFMLELEDSSEEAASIDDFTVTPPLAAELPSDEDMADLSPSSNVLATGRSHVVAPAADVAELDADFVLPQPLQTEMLPVVETRPAAEKTPSVSQPPQPIVSRSATPKVAHTAESEIVIDASLMEWSSATGRKQPISRTLHMDVDSAWEPVRPEAQPIDSASEPEFQPPVSDQPSAQNSSAPSRVVSAVVDSHDSASQVVTTSLVTSQPVALPQVVSRLTNSTASESESAATLTGSIDPVIPQGPATWLQTVEAEPIDEASLTITTRQSSGPIGLIDRLASTWNVSTQVVGLVFGGCGLLALGSGLLLFRGSRSQAKL